MRRGMARWCAPTTSARSRPAVGWELLAYGVTRVIDLRWINERDEDPQAELGVEMLHVPLFGDNNERREADRELLERIPDHAECRTVMYLEHMEAYVRGSPPP